VRSFLRITKELDGKAWTGLMWLRIGSVVNAVMDIQVQ